MNRVLLPENNEAWLGWPPSQTRKKQARIKKLLTGRAAFGNRLVGLRFALPVSLGYNFEHEPEGR